MDTKKFLLGSAGAFISVFLLGGLWHMLIMGDFYTTHTTAIARAEPNMLFIVLGSLVLGILMSYTYPIGYKGGTAVKEGFRFGALIGLIWILPFSLIMHGVWNLPLVAVIVDAAWHVVEEGIVGIVVAMIYGTVAAASE